MLEDTGTKSLKYIYDFGDNWEHTVKVEAIAAPELQNAYPRLVNAQRRCPPEDVGGPWGLVDLKATANVSHERHAEMIAGRGRDREPTEQTCRDKRVAWQFLRDIVGKLVEGN